MFLEGYLLNGFNRPAKKDQHVTMRQSVRATMLYKRDIGSFFCSLQLHTLLLQQVNEKYISSRACNFTELVLRFQRCINYIGQAEPGKRGATLVIRKLIEGGQNCHAALMEEECHSP